MRTLINRLGKWFQYLKNVLICWKVAKQCKKNYIYIYIQIELRIHKQIIDFKSLPVSSFAYATVRLSISQQSSHCSRQNKRRSHCGLALHLRNYVPHATLMTASLPGWRRRCKYIREIDGRGGRRRGWEVEGNESLLEIVIKKIIDGSSAFYYYHFVVQKLLSNI